MARKLKFQPKKNQPGLFDLTGDLFAPADAGRQEEYVHPSIQDFVVNVAAAREAESRDKKAADPMEEMEVDSDALNAIDALTFISFGSGSSGNCAYLGDSKCGFLIDAGVDADKVKTALKANGLSFDNVKGICLTHDHGDHVRYAYTLVRKHPHIGVYCTPKALSGLLRRHNISRRIKDYHRPIYKEFPFKIGDFEITAFEVSHDGTDNSGYFITHGNHRFAIATDLGCITPRVDYYMRQANYVMLESNYDAHMLQTGPYPMHLKARIAAANGHLDNVETGRFLSEIQSPQLRYVFLCHLSQDNNTPDTALSEVRSALLRAGVKGVGDGSGTLESRICAVQLVALPRFEASQLYSLRLE